MDLLFYFMQGGISNCEMIIFVVAILVLIANKKSLKLILGVYAYMLAVQIYYWYNIWYADLWSKSREFIYPQIFLLFLNLIFICAYVWDSKKKSLKKDEEVNTEVENEKK